MLLQKEGGGRGVAERSWCKKSGGVAVGLSQTPPLLPSSAGTIYVSSGLPTWLKMGRNCV